MFVIAHQGARRVRRQGCLASAGQAEKDRALAILADIGRAMHRHDPLGRQKVIYDGEDGFLHLARIRGAANQDDLAGEIDGDHGLRGAAMPLRIGGETGHVYDGEFRIKTFQLIRRGADQQLVHEQRMPGEFGNHPDADAMGEVRAAEQILREKFPPSRVRHHVGVEQIELGRRHRLVIVPPDLGLGGGIAHGEFIGG